MSQSDYKIYSDYIGSLNWILDDLRRELSHMPTKFKPLSSFYLNQRMFILTEEPVNIDRRLGRPLPFLAFWFSNLFGIVDKNLINKIGLTLSYMALFVSIRDDLLDSKIGTTDEHIWLSNFYYSKYYKIFREIIPKDSKFWFIMAECFNNWSEYECWAIHHKVDKNTHPLSQHYLQLCSKYLVATTLPTIAAIATLTNNKNKISLIRKFLTHYWIAFKIIDDVRDIGEDAKKSPNFNHSSVVYYLLKQLGYTSIIHPQSLSGVFLNKRTIEDIYNTVEKHLILAKEQALILKSDDLFEFISHQLSYYQDEKTFFLKRIGHFNNKLESIIK